MEAVLGHPYSGALYGYFSDEIGGEWSHTKAAKGHSYYRTLYGSNYKSYVEVALTFLLLYDRIHMTPADNHIPRSRIDPDNINEIYELGLHVDWEDFRSINSIETNNSIQRYLEDSEIRRLLGAVFKIPERVWLLIIESAIYESGLSRRLRCPLLCSPGRRLLIQRLIEIDKPALHPILSELHEIQFIESYQSLSGMALSPKSLDDLMDAKPDADVRKYGERFLDLAFSSSGPDNPATSRKVAELIRESMEIERLARLFAGKLKWAGSLFRLADIGAGSVATAVGGFASDLLADRSGWHEFSGSIDAAISKASLMREIQTVLDSDKSNA